METWERVKLLVGTRVCWPRGRAGHVMFAAVTPYTADFFVQQGHGTRLATPLVAIRLITVGPRGLAVTFTRHGGESLYAHKRIASKHLGAYE